MKLKTLAAAMAISVGTFAGSAHAIQITNSDGTFGFTGFDWAQAGTAFTNGPVTAATTDPFTLQYFASANSLQNGVSTFVPAGMDINPNGVADGAYEYTIVANINEQLDRVDENNNFFIDILGGSYTIYYHTAPNANALGDGLGVGFDDGIPIISGNIFALQDTIFNAGVGFTATAIRGDVTNTNLSFIDPALDTTRAVTTLQLGDFTTNWVNPGGFSGVAFNQDAVVLQADANQSFGAPTQVPEPASLALLAIGLAGLGWSQRSKKIVKA